MAEEYRGEENVGHFAWYIAKSAHQESLPYQKIGGIIFYKYDDIVKLLEKNSASGDASA